MGLYMETLIKNEDIEGLLKALEYHDVDIRNKAAAALGELGDVRAITPLIQTLNDQNGHVSKSALEALVKIGNQGTKSLIAALKDKNLNIRSRVVLALGEIGDERAVKPLINALTDREAAVRYNATIALGNIGVESSLVYLVKTLNDENGHVRAKASEAIESIKKNNS